MSHSRSQMDLARGCPQVGRVVSKFNSCSSKTGSPPLPCDPQNTDMTDQSLCQDGAYNIPNRMKHTLEALTDMLPHSHYVYGIQCQPEQSKMLRVSIEWDNSEHGKEAIYKVQFDAENMNVLPILFMSAGLNYLNEMTEEGEEVSRQFRELEKEARTRRTHLKSYVESKRAFDTDSMIKAAALLKTKSEKLVSFL